MYNACDFTVPLVYLIGIYYHAWGEEKDFKFTEGNSLLKFSAFFCVSCSAFRAFMTIFEPFISTRYFMIMVREVLVDMFPFTVVTAATLFVTAQLFYVAVQIGPMDDITFFEALKMSW